LVGLIINLLGQASFHRIFLAFEYYSS